MFAHLEGEGESIEVCARATLPNCRELNDRRFFMRRICLHRDSWAKVVERLFANDTIR